ncbi:SVP1-like protein 2 [Monosporozyma unispora]
MKPYYEVSTNNDESCFCCCHGEGVTIYDSYPLQKRLNLIFNDKDDIASDNEGTGIGKCSLLNRSNYIALVGGAQNGIKPAFPVNQVVIWDDLLKKVIFKLKFIYPVERVFLTRLYILVLVFNEIQLFTFTNPPRRIYESTTLKTGPHIDFKLVKSTGIIAYESLNRVGQIYISSVESTPNNNNSKQYIPTNIIKAHKNAIHFIKVSPNGKYVATCSMRGTIIRVFNTVNGLLVNEFRRGLDMVSIYTMNFNQESTQLAVISNKQTLHIFQIDESQPFNKSVVSLRLYNPTIRNSKELFHSGDKCELIWNDNDQTLILIWLNYRIWIRYIIIYDKNINKFELIRESWRQLS